MPRRENLHEKWKEAGIAEVNGMERSFNIFRNSRK